MARYSAEGDASAAAFKTACTCSNKQIQKVGNGTAIMAAVWEAGAFELQTPLRYDIIGTFSENGLPQVQSLNEEPGHRSRFRKYQSTPVLQGALT